MNHDESMQCNIFCENLNQQIDFILFFALDPDTGGLEYCTFPGYGEN